ncbi:30S ribosomal protein S17 [Candidatus Microgenomates bacterium]|nr:30S ribosomal protein S17 [Candidatus Microgenomates bacterium]
MKILTGKVVSTKMQKTIIVEVENSKRHPLYHKIIRKRKKFKVHNESFKLKVGDKVEIVSTRPISKEKHFKVVKKIEKGK